MILTFHTTSNKMLGMKLLLIQARVIAVDLIKLISWKIVLIERVHKFQPTIVLVAWSMIAECFFLRNMLNVTIAIDQRLIGKLKQIKCRLFRAIGRKVGILKDFIYLLYQMIDLWDGQVMQLTQLPPGIFAAIMKEHVENILFPKPE